MEREEEIKVSRQHTTRNCNLIPLAPSRNLKRTLPPLVTTSPPSKPPRAAHKPNDATSHETKKKPDSRSKT